MPAPASTTRRDAYAPFIARILREHLETDAAGKLIIPADLKTIRAVLRERCPVYPKKHHPYRIWLDEIRVQLGIKQPVAGRGRPPRQALAIDLPDASQGELFRNITPELRLIEVIMRAAIAGKCAAVIHAGTQDLIGYPVVVRIIDLAGQGKTPEQILKRLHADEARARRLAPTPANTSTGGRQDAQTDTTAAGA